MTINPGYYYTFFHKKQKQKYIVFAKRVTLDDNCFFSSGPMVCIDHPEFNERDTTVYYHFEEFDIILSNDYEKQLLIDYMGWSNEDLILDPAPKLEGELKHTKLAKFLQL